MQEYKSISNGRTTENSGVRRIVFTSTGEVREVVNAIYNGPIVNRHTLQKARKNDIVYENQYGLVNGVIKFTEEYYVITASDKRMLSTRELESLPKKMKETLQDPAIVRWLSATKDSRCFLPPGFGWDGTHTTADLNKKRKLQQLLHLLDFNLIDYLFPMAKVTPRDILPTDWNLDSRKLGSLALPNEHDIVEDLWLYIVCNDGKVWVVKNVRRDNLFIYIPQEYKETMQSVAAIYLKPFVYNDKNFGLDIKLFKR